MPPHQTPSDLPTTGRSFVITLPDSEQFFALWLGLMQSLVKGWYWVERPGGLTIDETIEAFRDAINLSFGDGAPE